MKLSERKAWAVVYRAGDKLGVMESLHRTRALARYWAEKYNDAPGMAGQFRAIRVLVTVTRGDGK